MKSALILFVSILLGGATILSAQTQSASLTGQVVDATGAAVPGAQVVIADPARGLKQTVTSDERGDYLIPELQPGDHYQITASKAGFKTTTQENVSLQVAQAAKINLILAVGNVNESVTVSAQPPQLDTQTSSLGQVITGETVEDLPLNGRSTIRLIALTPGVTFSRSAYGQFGDVPVNSTFDTNFTINGGRAQSNEILIDGVPSSAGFFDQVTTLPIVDETQEFKVQSSDLSAQYGRYSGGVINVTTKSGTNGLHGDAYEFARNAIFDANDWFQKAGGKPPLAFSMNQFGGTIGGPVRIPGIYNGRDKTFFFFAYQGTRRTQGNSTIQSVPTAAERTGDFSALPTPIYDPNTTDLTVTGGAPIRKQFNDPLNGGLNHIPLAEQDKVALQMIKYYPLPNYGAPGATISNYQSTAPVTVSQNIYSGRIDQNVTQKYHLQARYEYTNTPLTQPNTYGNIATTGAGAVGTTDFTNQSVAFDNIYQFNDHLLINVNYGFARWFQSRTTLSYGFDNSTLDFPASFVSQITIPMFPGVAIGGGYSGFANQSYLNNGNDSHAVLISATLTAGKQTLSFGVDGRLHRINYFNVGNSAGIFNFAIAQTEGYTKNNTTITPIKAPSGGTTGDGFASFLSGVGSSGSFPIGSGVEMQDFYGAAYVQDDIRLTQKLTINLGLRYDRESPYTDRHNELNYFDPNVASPARNSAFPNLTGGLQFAAVNGSPRTVYSTKSIGLAPRLGFAYSPNSTTVVRGGYGISYAPLEIADNAVGFSPSLGYASSTGWNVSTDGYTPANKLANPYPQGVVQPTGNSLGAGTQLGQGLSVWAHNPEEPYAMQYNFDVQQQFPDSILFDAGYSGSKGEHLTSDFNENTINPTYLQTLKAGLNTLVPNPFAPFVSIGNLSNPTVTQQQLLLPFPQFTGVTIINDPYGWSTYNSMQVKLSKRETNGLQFLAAFTWSKLMSNVNAQEAAIGTTDDTSPQNYYDLNAEKAISELDQPFNFIFNSTYELPFGRGRHFDSNVSHGLDKLIGGWKVTGIWTEQSGFPLTLSAAGVGGGTRPDLVIGQNQKIPGHRSNLNITGINNPARCGSQCGDFNGNAFTLPQPYAFGTVPRSYANVRGPGVQNLDATLQKDIRFGDRWRAELRAEVFNVTNTPHFAMPNMTVQNANFGKITALISSPPVRQIQFAGKVYF